MFAIAEKRSSSTEGPQNVISVLESTIARIDTLSKLENHSGVTGVTTGFIDLDKKNSRVTPRISSLLLHVLLWVKPRLR